MTNLEFLINVVSSIIIAIVMLIAIYRLKTADDHMPGQGHQHKRDADAR